MAEIVLSDAYLEGLTKNNTLLHDYSFIKDAGDSLRNISRKGCSCNWGPKVKAVLEQMRSVFCALPAEEVSKIKKMLNVEGRSFVTYRKTTRGNQKVIL